MIKGRGTYSTTMHPTPESEALNENTVGDRLRELAETGDEAIRLAVAQNPNTPPDVLLRLFNKFPLQVLNNPVLDVLLLENLNFLEELYLANTRIFLEVVGNDNIPTHIFEKLAKAKSNTLILAVAKNSYTPASTLEYLAQDGLSLVRRTVAANENTPNHTLKQLAKDRYEDVRLAVAENSYAPVNVLEQLAEDEIADVRLAVANNLRRRT